MKYKVIYGDGHVERTNNKAIAKKWANERYGPATVIIDSNGDIVYENAAQRRINNSYSTLNRIASDIKAGKPIEQIIELNH